VIENTDVEKVSPHDHGDAPRVCARCGLPLAGCSSGLFCVGCGQRHGEFKRWGYADLKPSIYYLPT